MQKEEQKRKPHESHKRLTVGPWMDVSEEAVRAPSGNCGSLRKPRGSGKQEEEQGADCNSPSSTFHRSPAAAVRRKLLLNSTGNILIHSFLTGSFLQRLLGWDWLGYFSLRSISLLLLTNQIVKGENSFLGWLTSLRPQIESVPEFFVSLCACELSFICVNFVLTMSPQSYLCELIVLCVSFILGRFTFILLCLSMCPDLAR